LALRSLPIRVLLAFNQIFLSAQDAILGRLRQGFKTQQSIFWKNLSRNFGKTCHAILEK
jgi:hypothetical protein